jgi:predicted transposase/invertase (TIGR01784 family)
MTSEQTLLNLKLRAFGKSKVKIMLDNFGKLCYNAFMNKTQPNEPTTTESKPNRQYKASVFSTLFGEEPAALEVYNALAAHPFPPGTPVKMQTLGDVLFMNRINDLAFLIGNLLIVLIEHQSSLNENLPLRLLLYIARVYEIITDNKLLYRQTLVKIPAPQFIVLYNGEQELPNGQDKMTLKLSDAFEQVPELAETLPLELEVTVYNINKGHSEDILAKSETLNGYATFIAAVRKRTSTGLPLSDAITQAVTECVNENVLADFLLQNSSEVLNMLTQEWDWDTAFAVRYEEGYERGIERGNIEAARRLYEMNLTLEQISKATQLSPDKLRTFFQKVTVVTPQNADNRD